MSDSSSSLGSPGSRLRGLRLKGTLTAGEDVMVDGDFDGGIEMPGHALTIAEAARVSGTVFARDVTVKGTLTGKTTATEIVDVRSSAAVKGDITAPTLIVEDGALVQGRVEMKRADAAVRVARYRMERRDHDERGR